MRVVLFLIAGANPAFTAIIYKPAQKEFRPGKHKGKGLWPLPLSEYLNYS
jgi:hypothetical protein